MSLSLAENVIVARADNRPPMLDKTQYSSWASRMTLYIKGKRKATRWLSSQWTFQIWNSNRSWNCNYTCNCVKLAKDLNDTNFDQLYAYLRQHEAYADKVRIMKERLSNPLALVANTYNYSPFYSNQTQYHQQISLFATQQQVSPLASQHLYDVPMIQQHSSQAPIANHSLVVHRQSYQAPDVHQPSQASFPLLDSGLVVPSFLPSDDPIASLNKAMTFISTAFTSRYPPTNN
ncbi:hypothetical protein Tco_0902066 [Tanacetum coccineum]|uniref:Integrase, catalytic region, zinc finger, CCHC-type, peptidase aspartic, catalytic n=1 Tax=Tanacetum coccineum TaxID=301880 RepID=A0ABQ5B689_9ASTR